MNTPVPPGSHAAPERDDTPHVVKTEYKFSHVTTQRYLPTPGKAPGWPFAEIRTGHDAMVSAPEETARLLLGFA